MANIKINCPGGETSQTGVAVLKRYPECEIIPVESIEVIEKNMDSTDNLICVPIWNSNLGEVKKSAYIWDNLVSNKVKIFDIWAKEIKFWHIKKPEHESSGVKVGSVSVVSVQCSKYLKELELTLVSDQYLLSNAAFDAYKKEDSDSLQGVFIAPVENDSELHDFQIVSKQAENPNNFTTFVQFQHTNYCTSLIGNNHLTGVEIRPIKSLIGESEKEFFDNIFKNVKHIDQVPKLLFVLDRTAKVGLLFESENVIYIDDVLDVETIEKSEINVHDGIGCTEEKYSSQLHQLLEDEFEHLLKGDFLVHEGDRACFFSCPALGIYTHGYDRSVMEPVIRFYISNFFQAIYDDVACTSAQNDFFNRYKDQWIESKSEFIDFTVV